MQADENDGYLVKDSVLMKSEYFTLDDETSTPATKSETQELPSEKVLNSDKYFVLINKERRVVLPGE